jgi:hypothetical protein
MPPSSLPFLPFSVRWQTRVRWGPPRQADLWQARQHRRAAGESCNEHGRDLYGSNAAPHSPRRAGTAHSLCSDELLSGGVHWLSQHAREVPVCACGRLCCLRSAMTDGRPL